MSPQRESFEERGGGDLGWALEGMRGDGFDGEERTFCGCSLSVAIAHSPTFIPLPNPCFLTRIAEPTGGGGCS